MDFAHADDLPFSALPAKAEDKRPAKIADAAAIGPIRDGYAHVVELAIAFPQMPLDRSIAAYVAERIDEAALRRELRWSWFVGQPGGLAKVYSAVRR